MKAHLLYPDRDFAFGQSLDPARHALIEDLALPTLFEAMARGDALLYDLGRDVLLASETDLSVIRYRQAILEDGLREPQAVRNLFRIAEAAVTGEKRIYFGGYASRYPAAILRRGIEVMAFFTRSLKALRAAAADSAPCFRSQGLRVLVDALERELDDPFFRTVAEHLKRLQFREGITVAARLGRGNRAVDFVLTDTAEDPTGWLSWWPRRGGPALSLTVSDRDEAGAQAVSRLQDRGINLVANELARAADHLKSFLVMLERELGFYVGCLNLAEALRGAGASVSLPNLYPVQSRRIEVTGLYDPGLPLAGVRPVGNDLDRAGQDVLMVTGANQGGKSTFLRAVGLAQLMAQCGMFVAATRYAGTLHRGIFSHFRREEDPELESGKLDEEMGRLSRLVEHLVPGSLVLFNESFAATNEREGAKLATDVVRALASRHITVVYVTHLYALYERLRATPDLAVLYLRAERGDDGQRTFKIRPGPPLATSFGRDLYRDVFPDERSQRPGR